VRIAKRTDGVKTLLVGTVPKNVGTIQMSVLTIQWSMAVSFAARLCCSRSWFIVSMIASA
jgi:hypothetical protein